jgi:hypothetical protein
MRILKHSKTFGFATSVTISTGRPTYTANLKMHARISTTTRRLLAMVYGKHTKDMTVLPNTT